MRKKWLKSLNTLLGTISMGLLSCNSSPQECLYGSPEPVDLYGCPPPEELIMAKYACPPEMLEERGAYMPEREKDEGMKE